GALQQRSAVARLVQAAPVRHHAPASAESRLTMLRFEPAGGGNKKLQILCLGCHSDDIEIGCGGTILRLAAEHPEAQFHWVVLSAIGVRANEAKQGATLFVDPSRLETVVLKGFPDGFMPYVGADIKHLFEDLKRAMSPDLI